MVKEEVTSSCHIRYLLISTHDIINILKKSHFDHFEINKIIWRRTMKTIKFNTTKQLTQSGYDSH